ncbi:MAG: hypothetical protein mread185_000563 [Mycoplasmataceae bacterium]|nr:MAG: hypothetical protein mread185_000563 [Mycoplasmataceae bacterium]
MAKKPLTKEEKQALIAELQENERRRQEVEAQNNLANQAEEPQWKVSEQDENTLILDDWDGKVLNLNDSESTQTGNLVKITVNWGNDEQGKPIITEDLIRKTDEVGANYKKFSGKNLIFRNCKNLKRVEADCLEIKGIKFEEECAQLEHLSAYNNEIEELDLTNQKQLNYLNVDDNKLKSLQVSGCANLDNLSCRNNKLRELDLSSNSKITELDCSYNLIKQLKITHLDWLKRLNCNNNCLIELNCSFLKYLYFLNLSNNGRFDNVLLKEIRLNELNVKGCKSLGVLDAGENGFEEVELNNHPNLWHVSFKSNGLSKITIKRCPKLRNLIISYQTTKKIIKSFFRENQLNTIDDLLSFLNISTLDHLISLFDENNPNLIQNLLLSLNIQTIEDLLDAAEEDFYQGKGTITKALNNLGFDTPTKVLSFLDYKNLWNILVDEKIHTDLFVDDSTRKNLRGVLHDEDISFYGIKNEQSDSGYASENKECDKITLTRNFFPNLDKGISGIDLLEDNPFFEEEVDRKIEEEENAELGYDSSYEREEAKKKKNSEPIITDPNQLKNKYPDLLKGKFGQGPEITITGGRLAGTLIIDGYQGYKINVGNNRGLEYLWIKNCPNLTTLRYAHCGLKNGDAFIDWDSCRNLKTIDKYNCDGRIEWGNPEDEENEQTNQATFNEELKQSAEDQKQDNLKDEFYKLLLEMLSKAERYADQGDKETVKQKVAEVKQKVSQSHNQLTPAQLAEIKERIKQLEQRLESSQTLQPPISKVLIGSIGISLLAIGLLFWLINKQIKKIKS